jgi:hypothetical protein
MLDRIAQLKPPLNALSQLGNLTGAGCIGGVEGRKMLLNGCQPGLDAGKGKAHLGLNVVELAMDAAQHLLA